MNSHRLSLIRFWRMLWILIAGYLHRCFTRFLVFVKVIRIKTRVGPKLDQCIFHVTLRIHAYRLSRRLEYLKAWRRCQLIALNFGRFLYQLWFESFSQMMNLRIKIHFYAGNETFSWFHNLFELFAMVWAFTLTILKTSLFLMTLIY